MPDAAPSEPLSARDLAAFVAAVEAGSVQGAADALMLTQSAATKRLQRLELRLGVELLHRTRAGVRPTEAGRSLYPDAREALAALERAEQRVRASRGVRDATLRLASSHTIGGFLLPRWLAAFRAAAPDVLPQLDVVNSFAVLERLRDREADVGFVEGVEELAAFERLAVGVDALVAVVGPGHRWARRRDVRPEELSREPFHAREPSSAVRRFVDRQLAEHGVDLRPAVQMASTLSLKRSVREGGFAFLSRHAVEDEVAAGTLVALPVRGVDLSRRLFAIRRPGERPPEAARRLWRWLETRAATPDPDRGSP
ncbi:MAG TPA: LysR family transcriptional regulator [Baekduia sp.]|nr:LysR family transcriptional regulator [Baekduia sp.]